MRDAADEGLPFWSSIVSAHTFGLGALLELKTKLTQGEIIEGAKKMSHLVARMPEQQGLAGYCVYGVRGCVTQSSPSTLTGYFDLALLGRRSRGTYFTSAVIDCS